MAEIIAAMAAGLRPLLPLRMAASVVIGPEALTTTTVAGAIVAGVVVHLLASTLFGAIYGLVNSSFSQETETSYARQAGLGMLYGVALWIATFQIIARIAYPWFLDTSQGLQVVLHALTFGLPLALMYALAERRVQLVRPQATTA
ncbi:hypothetical protein OEB96_22765 [Paraliomyxa miuraensis]|nr:hypothetical protein [Paraliomyxa miuraensis]